MTALNWLALSLSLPLTSSRWMAGLRWPASGRTAPTYWPAYRAGRWDAVTSTSRACTWTFRPSSSGFKSRWPSRSPSSWNNPTRSSNLSSNSKVRSGRAPATVAEYTRRKTHRNAKTLSSRVINRINALLPIFVSSCNTSITSFSSREIVFPRKWISLRECIWNGVMKHFFIPI